MKLHKYDSEEQYRQIQIEANKRKIDWVWVKRSSIDLICDYMERGPLQRRDKNGIYVLCHGTRNGKEQEFFKLRLQGYATIILGTEISPTASEFPNTVQHDFHEQKYSWVNRFDIVYSNALDHSHSPRECVEVWREQLNKTGRLFIEWSKDNLKNNAINPFAGTWQEWADMFPVVDILDGDGTKILVVK